MTTSTSPYNIYPGLTPARLVRTSNLAGTYLNGSLNNGVGATLTIAASSLTVDSVVTVVDDRLVLMAQTNANENGIYVVTSIGSTVVLTRAEDFQSIEQLQLGQYISVGAGTLNAGAIFSLVEPKPAILGVSNLVLTASPLNSGFGTASTKAASDNSKATVASVSGATIANELAVFADTAGTVKDASTTVTLGFPLIVSGAVSAGKSGTAGIVSSFPSAATTGSLRLVGVANAGNFNIDISNASHAQATVYTLADIGASTGGIPTATSAFRMKSVAAAAAAGGAAAQSFTDAFCTSASNVIGNWNTQANAASVLKIVPGNGSFVVTSSADAGVGTFNYMITKA